MSKYGLIKSRNKRYGHKQSQIADMISSKETKKTKKTKMSKFAYGWLVGDKNGIQLKRKKTYK